MKKIFLISLTLFNFLILGCASFDNGLNAVGDALSGDFRSLGKSTETTMDAICKDLQANTVTGQEKWSRSLISVKGVIARISGKYGDAAGFYVAFKDLNRTNHIGSAWTRSANLSNQEKVSGLKVGDKIKITGILDMKFTSVSNSCSLGFDKSNFLKLN